MLDFPTRTIQTQSAPENAGTKHLAELDISKFDPKAPPPKTEAFWDIVHANSSPEEGELADVLEKLADKQGNPPPATTLDRISAKAPLDLQDWLRDRRNRRTIPHRLEAVGYTPVRNPGARDGLWKVENARQVIYGRAGLSLRDRLKAATELADRRPANDW
jgi:hypothetical protein